MSALPLFLLLIVIVVAFTSPWDNLAVKWRIWDFPQDRLWFRIGYLPIEEYFFFVIQTCIVGLLTVAVAAMQNAHRTHGTLTIREGLWVVVFLTLWLIGGSLFRRLHSLPRRLTYSWHLFYWFLPVIIVQWIIASEVLIPNVLVVLLCSSMVGTYLTFADIVAVRHGIWFFDEEQTTGIKIFSILPWEEAAFFYVTSLLVSQSTLLLLPPIHSSG